MNCDMEITPDLSIEEKTVKMFCQKRCRDRIIWELGREDDRFSGIYKATEMSRLRSNMVYKLDYLDEKELKEKVLQLGGKTCAYYLSFEYQGKIAIEKAIHMARYEGGMSGVIVYFGNGVAYYHEGELEHFPVEYLLVHPDNKNVNQLL